jgi:hypothetical protein
MTRPTNSELALAFKALQSAAPAGPYRYRPDKHDDWGFVRGPSGDLVANTCPPSLGRRFSDENPSYDEVRKAGPPQAAALANLLAEARTTDLPDRLLEFEQRLRNMHRVCTRDNCILDGGPEHEEFFKDQP